MDVRDTFKAGETEVRSWWRAWGIGHPLGALFVGAALGAGTVAILWHYFG